MALPLKQGQLELLPGLVMAKAKLVVGKTERNRADRTWQQNFLTYLDKIEEVWGQRAVLIELCRRLMDVNYADYGDERGLVIRRGLEILKETRGGPELDLGISPKEMTKFKAATLWAMENFQPLFPAREWVPEHLRPPSKTEVLVTRRMLRIDSLSDEELIRRNIWFVGACALSQYEMGFLTHNGRSLSYCLKYGRTFRLTPSQRAYAERLYVGDPKERPLVGLCRRPLRLHLKQAEKFRQDIGSEFVNLLFPPSREETQFALF